MAIIILAAQNVPTTVGHKFTQKYRQLTVPGIREHVVLYSKIKVHLINPDVLWLKI